MNKLTLKEREYNNTHQLFNIGDKVTVRSDIRAGDKVVFGFNEDMERFIGKTLEVVCIGKTDARLEGSEETTFYKYTLKNNSWSWSADMFELKEDNEI